MPFNPDSAEARALPHPGDFAFRAAPGSEKHMNDPAAIAALQAAAQSNDRCVWVWVCAQAGEGGGGGGACITTSCVCVWLPCSSTP